MTVLKFAPPENLPSDWQFTEVQKLVAACSGSLSSGDASGWEVGKTEAGDPQLYLLGPAPDYDCILSVSRLESLYVLEDGNGRVLFENWNLALLAQHARAALSRCKMIIFAEAACLWATIRHTIEEKIEPMLAEPIEIVTNFSPQLAAFV